MNIKINTKNRLNSISPILYGIFFEDINYAGDGGLYGELIANRSFEYYDRDGKCDKHKMCWETVGSAAFEIKTENPINNVHTHYAHVCGNGGEGIRNTSYCKEGFSVHSGDVFDFSCYASSDSAITLVVKICDADKVYGTTEINVNNNTWTKFEKEIEISGDCKNAFLEIIFKDGGDVRLEFISLFNKDTFCGRKNGLRRDLAEMLKDLEPKFMRFPGGCIVEGRSFHNMYCWKDTIGPVETRRTNWNRWQMEQYQPEGRCSADYFQSYGLGYYEYFLLCEDLGAKPVPVMNVGMTCQWHEGLLVDIDKLDKWIQDVLDLIEFANGDENSEWGKKRIEMGHKEPFGLEYIGIGNEQWGEEYFERYDVFQKRISEKYPDIKLITSAGWNDSGKEFDLAVDWMKNNKEKAYAVDEHFYKNPEWFFDNVSRYDNYDRTMPKVFAGEYASHTAGAVPERKNNWLAAISEAAFLTGIERNSDHVVMSCYAPLFARINHQQWQPNLIWFDNDSCYVTPSYYVQKLFSRNIGDYIAETQCDDTEVYISASVSEDEKQLFVKIVNVSDSDKSVNLDIDREFEECIMHELYGELETERNLSSEQQSITDINKAFNIKSNSVTVLCFKK